MYFLVLIAMKGARDGWTYMALKAKDRQFDDIFVNFFDYDRDIDIRGYFVKFVE